jgi:hypothetical protein
MADNQKPVRLSHAHEDADLRADNPLYKRTGSLRAAFHARPQDDDPEREARRQSFMVKRQQSRPVLRPSLALSLGPDGASFDAQWNEERKLARPRER